VTTDDTNLKTANKSSAPQWSQSLYYYLPSWLTVQRVSNFICMSFLLLFVSFAYLFSFGSFSSII